MLELLTPLFVIGLAGWLWRDSLRAREAAIAACSRACEAEGVQLLDQTVAIVALTVVWWQGRLRLKRVYGFEFSRDGVDRVQASVTMLGASLLTLHLPQPTPPPAGTGTQAEMVELRPRRLH